MKKVYHYKVVTQVQNGLGILARITIMLRKFNVNVQSLHVTPLDEDNNFYNLYWILDSTKDPESFAVVANKLERIVPILKVTFEKI
jgi:acetolactate synthase small subunit